MIGDKLTLLNLGCGNTRPGEPWTNMDSHKGVPTKGEGGHFIVHNLKNPIPDPFGDNTCDGIFANHFIEHLDAQEAVRLIVDAKRVLKPGGILCIGVPNASYHRAVWTQDTRENSMHLFGEPIPSEDPVGNNLRRALFFWEHKQIFTEDSLWCHLVVAGFDHNKVKVFDAKIDHPNAVRQHFKNISNRLHFTLFMEAEK